MNKVIVSVFALIIMLSACSQTTIKTESGIEVTFIEKQNTGALVDNTLLNYHMRYESAKGTELFNSTTNGGKPVTIQYSDSTWKTSGIFYEAMKLCEVGDSVIFEIPAKDLFENTFKMSVPDSLDSASNIKFFVGLESAMTNDEYQAFKRDQYAAEQKKRVAAIKEQLDIDTKIIDKYLQDNGIEAISTESGLRYVITKSGSGDNAVAGQPIVAHYHGTLLDGSKFDSSYDRNQPFEFVLGQGRVIRGWDEGFALLNKGAKATLYIPSPLAYGPAKRSEVILANSILKFEVELVDIK